MPGTTNAALLEWMECQRRAWRWYMPLHNLLFGINPLRYFLYRTRYAVLLVVLRGLLHLIEFTLIIHTLPAMLYPAMILRLASLALEGGWWGATDAMRHGIRRLRRQRNLLLIQQEIAGWMALAAGLAAAIFIGAAALAWHSSSLSLPYAALVLAIGFQTAVRILARTLYSGAYALRRVFLPIEFIIGPEVCVFLLGMLLHSVLGDWTVSLCIAISSVLVAAAGYVSIRRVTDFLRVTPPRLFAGKSLRFVFARYHVRELAMPALAMLGIRLHDVVLILALQSLAVRELFAQKLLFALYLVAPFLRGGMSWAQVMYFDLSRYGLDMFAEFRHALEKAGMFYSLLLALFFCALEYVVVRVMAAAPFYASIHIVALYTVASSLLGFVLVSLFSRRRYGMVALLCALQYGLLWALMVWKIGYFRIWQSLLLSLVITVLAGWWQLRGPWVAPQGPLFPYLSWAARLRRRRQPVQLMRIAFHPEAKPFLLQVLANRLGESGLSGALACIYRHQVLIAADTATPDGLSPESLLRQGGGLITAIDTVQAENGAAAYRSAQAQGMLPVPYGGALLPHQEMAARFLQLFPSGMVHVPMHRQPLLVSLTDDEARREILREAQQGMALESRRRSKSWFVTMLYDDPYITTLLIVPRHATTDAQRKSWGEEVNQWNLAMLERG